MSTERALQMTRLTQQSWNVTVTRRSDGTPLNLTGYFGVFAAKRQTDYADAAVEFTAKSTDGGTPINFTSPANGQLTITISKSKTTSIPKTGLKLFYELKLVSSGGIPIVPLYGTLDILPNIYDAES